MTFRLVALMTGVLLLTLAAFGLMIGHYQEQVLQQVADTASEVGRATLRTIELRSDHPSVDQRAEGFIVWSDGSPSTDPGKDGFEYTTLTPGDPSGEVSANFFIQVDEVRAVTDPGVGVVLKIPRLAPTGDGSGGAATFELKSMTDGRSESGFMARREEISLPVPMGEFRELFRTMRGRSLAVFFGVFLVGAVLTAGLASRFTRPMRRLDAGIRRLSAGDLDVELEVHGRDEVARLSHAFNEMAHKLRQNRDRSRELVRREKLLALGRLAAGVAHDVRNPLHSITLALDHLGEAARPEDGARAQELDRSLGLIRGEIRRLDDLTTNFLRFARSERREREPIDLHVVVEDTLLLVSKEAERRGVAIEGPDAEGDAIVDGDAEALRSVVLNLVLNAFEAMPDGGTLRVSLTRRNGAVALDVADTGEGIPEEDHERVFEFAYTTREGGNGLGLAMVHHCVVEEHGGRVELDSRPGAGTRVGIELPPATPATTASGVA